MFECKKWVKNLVVFIENNIFVGLVFNFCLLGVKDLFYVFEEGFFMFFNGEVVEYVEESKDWIIMLMGVFL